MYWCMVGRTPWRWFRSVAFYYGTSSCCRVKDQSGRTLRRYCLQRVKGAKGTTRPTTPLFTEDLTIVREVRQGESDQSVYDHKSFQGPSRDSLWTFDVKTMVWRTAMADKLCLQNRCSCSFGRIPPMFLQLPPRPSHFSLLYVGRVRVLTLDLTHNKNIVVVCRHVLEYLKDFPHCTGRYKGNLNVEQI